MARPKSSEKREAILKSAVGEIAQVGLGASTARIARGAQLADGTMFTYFPTKEDLFNELYVELKSEVYRRVDDGFPHGAALRERTRHIWTVYLHWALENPGEQKVSVLLNLSPIISAATRQRVHAGRKGIQQTLDELAVRGAFKDLPKGFASTAMLAMQQAVMDTAGKKARDRTLLIDQGFEAFWRMAK
ncbi:TetR/AcrR family transcriptional regulator [Acidipila sp. EB88]|uniref:TetR/AcrR family transcriptional regulator n=1 Tax=Acidipila sp. EB88 TaxID=2305226 RepID=UPI000F5DA46E|nr:TetR/AcrR family transcriptional regulator [Acidipila sp. EB88]RRA47281.1 TetR/AcrR family transcriptional regulator [Acidipila sp. EB88]